MDYTYNEYIGVADITLILDNIRVAYMNKLYDIPPLRRIRKYKNMGIIVNYGG